MPRKQQNTNPSYVEFGSAQHAALLGVETTEDPAERAKRQQALETKPVPVSNLDHKKPINKRTYNPGEPIMGGWKRRG